jgi:hypothetical protein
MPSVFRGSDNFDTAGGNAVKAWVNFNGTGTVAIRAAFNVSSITDNGTGDYTVNFTTAMPDANYSTSITSALNFGVYSAVGTLRIDTNPPTTTALRVISMQSNTTNSVDSAYVNVAIFR